MLQAVYDRANYRCPSCESLAVFRETGRLFVCIECESVTLESRLQRGATHR
jgi:ribosomal protein L37AE/L43A